MQLYVIQDSISRAYGEPFTGLNDEAVRRDLYQAMAYASLNQASVLDSVVLAVANVISDDDHYIIDPYPVPRLICRGSDSEVSKLVKALLYKKEVNPDEETSD